jgi:hypothetical protein
VSNKFGILTFKVVDGHNRRSVVPQVRSKLRLAKNRPGAHMLTVSQLEARAQCGSETGPFAYRLHTFTLPQTFNIMAP